MEKMMKASVYIATSLDGFIARENGDLDWLPGADGSQVEANPEDGDFGYSAFIESVDVLVMGRGTFEKVLSFGGAWPYGDKRVVVLSSRLTRLPDNLPQTVELKSGTPTDVVKELAASGAEHLYVDGGKTIQAFLNAGLIQELTITRIPVLIGSGLPLFGPVHKDLKLRHVETCVFSNGFVQSKYVVSIFA
ncbi:MAG: dihydrofolate reductase [Anaerolineales bacterium]|nr:dihydrofolate reductase [Anaerolineales bacterium]